MPGDEKNQRADSFRTRWLEIHHQKIGLLGDTLAGIEDRFEKLGPEVEERVQSEEYLTLVRQTFRTWDDAEVTKRGTAPTTLESAFEDTKPYVVTELGKQFVHYTMNDVVVRISAEAEPATV